MNNTGLATISESADVSSLPREALSLRLDIVNALHNTGGGHYGGCLSVVDIILSLYRFKLNVSPNNPSIKARDRFVLSKGHAALSLYAVLRRLGFFTDSLNRYASFLSRLEGHPDMTCVPGIDFSTGSLGQGLSVATGMAYGLRRSTHKVWVVLGDGECQEGQIWEAAMLASSCKLKNLRAVVDLNKHQEWGRSPSFDDPNPVPVDALADKWKAFGWHVVECDGHDFEQLRYAFDEADSVTSQPSVVVAHTVKGKGSKLIESNPRRFHCDLVTDEEHLRVLRELQDDEVS